MGTKWELWRPQPASSRIAPNVGAREARRVATAGYWAVFVTIAAEQFGTNLRATVATTVPNFVRGSVPLITGSFSLLRGPLGYVGSAWMVGLACIALALVSLRGMAETAGRDLDFVE